MQGCGPVTCVDKHDVDRQVRGCQLLSGIGSVLAAEGGVEGRLRGGEVELFEGGEGFGGAVEAVHAGVFHSMLMGPV